LQQEGASGLVVLREDVCTGCGLCEDACPFDAIWIDEQTSVAVKCDLCDGAPVCVEYGPRGALSYE
jgi:Fe-S-cluster-containing hydrogenase component 2